jgi:hypothetical protein
MNNNTNIINSNNTLIILDWDDTLFPTTWFIHNNINLNETYMKKLYTSYFYELDNIIYKLLKKIILLGDVTIITNALIEWINTSSSVLPKTKKIINNKIHIISARGNFQNKYPNIMDWKKEAFKLAKSHKYINIISVGDAHYEYNALIGLYNKESHILLKSIKFMNEPIQEVLIDQLNVLYNIIPKICNILHHLDLNFKLKHEFVFKKKM